MLEDETTKAKTFSVSHKIFRCGPFAKLWMKTIIYAKVNTMLIILKYGVANFAFISLQDFVLKTILTLKKLFFGV